MTLISNDLITRKLASQMQSRDERVIRDSKLTGYCIRIRRRADDTFAVSFYVDHLLPTGKRRKITIGEHPTFSETAAREEATKMLQAIAKGDDPAAERRKKKEAPFFEDLVIDFERDFLPTKSAATQKDYKGRIRRILKPTLKGVRVRDIDLQMLQALRRKKAKKPTDFNRGMAVLSKMMTFAIVAGMRSDNPCKSIERFTETPRDQWIDERDMPLFIVALNKIDTPTAELVRFLTVTGWRVSKARLLTWEQVDLLRQTVRLGDTATKKSASVISDDAATLISRQPHRAGFVFSNCKGREPVAYDRVLELMREVCKTAGIAKATPHVLRHSAATHAALAGATSFELKQSFGWASLSMTDRYVSKAENLAKSGAEKAAGAIGLFRQRVDADAA